MDEIWDDVGGEVVDVEGSRRHLLHDDDASSTGGLSARFLGELIDRHRASLSELRRGQVS